MISIRPSVFLVQNNAVLTLTYLYNGTEVHTLPGGNLEFGENLKDALIRELEEELGITVVLGDILTSAEVHLNEKQSLHIIFEGISYSGSPKVNPKETTAKSFEWVPINQVDTCNFYPNLLNELVEKGKSIKKYLGKLDQKRY